MANEGNLKNGEPYRFKAGEKQVEIARKGGIASGEAKRRKKTMRETAKMLLDMEVPKQAGEMKRKLAAMGVTEEDYTYQTAVIVGILNQAMKGNTKAATFLRDTIGENPAEMGEGESTLADAIEDAYEKRMEMEGEQDVEQ
ncbi:MAG: hypothetical protein LUF92_02205 [Clostridiales bacterium]|nr:hypothetical protein [Clostridiales bacterium]